MSLKEMQHEDQFLGLAHGDVLVSEYNGKFLFRFRCGPAPRWTFAWSVRASNGARKHAYGSHRYPRTRRALTWAHAHSAQGIHVRHRGNKDLPTAWDGYTAHGEKCWKRHRRTQYRAKMAG